MRITTTIGCAVGMLMVASSVMAQDAKATEILAKTRAALGGAKLEALKTFALDAATQRNVGPMQMSSEVEIALELPDKYVRSEVSRGMMNMTMHTGFNGDKAIVPANVSLGTGGTVMFRMESGGPVVNAAKMTDEQKAQLNAVSLRNSRAELSRLMLGWFGMAHPMLQAQYTYAGEAESPDGKAHVIDVRSADGFEARLFVDQNNYLPLMVTYKGRQPRVVTQTRSAAGAAAHDAARGSTRQLSPEERKKLEQDREAQMQREPDEAPLVEFSMFFDDWREVGGITFPHVLRRGAGGETTEEWTVSSVKVNPKLDAKTFAVDRQ